MGKVGRPRGMTFKVKLTAQQQEQFKVDQKRGQKSARVLGRMRMLLLADQGLEPEEIAVRENVCSQTVYNTVKRFVTMGEIEDKLRSGRPEKVSGQVKAHIIATACTAPPKGHIRWTLRLLADRVVQLELLDSLSKNTVGRILKKAN